MKAIIEIDGMAVITPASFRSKQDTRRARERGNVISLITAKKGYTEFKNEVVGVMTREYGVFFNEEGALSILAPFFPENIKEVVVDISTVWAELVQRNQNPFLAGCRVWKRFSGELENDKEIWDKKLSDIEKMFVRSPYSKVVVGFSEKQALDTKGDVGINEHTAQETKSPIEGRNRENYQEEKRKMEMRALYLKERRNIMKAVHKKNAFGHTASQIDFFADMVRIDTHQIPARTQYAFLTPLLSFTVHHNPFISYSELDDIFDYALSEKGEGEQREKEYTEEAGE